jgi:hypothetical protein
MFFNKATTPERTTVMNARLNQMREIASQNGLRYNGIFAQTLSTVYTHVQCEDSTIYELFQPMSAQEIVLSAMVANSLLLKVVDGEEEYTFSTSRLLAYYNNRINQFDGIWWPAQATKSGWTGDWVKTQNKSFGLFSIKREYATTESKGTV